MKYIFIDNQDAKFDVVMKIRYEVFTNEQGAIKEEEFDKYDELKSTLYLLVYDDNDEPCATGRIVKKGKDAKIGRIAVLKSKRGSGMGALLVNVLCERAKTIGAKNIFVDAQIHAVPFYEKFGFVPTGERTIVDRGIKHCPMVKSLKSKSKFKITVIILILLVAVAGALFGFGYKYVQNDINGIRNTSSDTSVNFIISGYDFEDAVASNLKSTGIIKNDIVWKYWMEINYPDFVYINGEYLMNPTMTYEQIAEKLQNPDISHRTVKVVIPEGYNCMEIAKTLEENEVCKADEFLEACKNAKNYDFDFLESVPNNSLIAYQLEGFLFPATYDLAQNSEPKDVIEYMLETFGYHYTDDMKEYCKKNDTTLYELLTLASVVQEEAFGVDSAGNIASVFVNRLAKGNKLQSDVTYFYAAKLRDDYGFSQEVYDAYYTYRCPGLPAGPITNSGDDIIKAVVNHPKTNYYFFYSDLNQEFHFANNYNEFLAQQEKYPWK